MSIGLSNEAKSHALCGVDEESAEKTGDSVPHHLASEDLEDSQGGVEMDVVEEVCECAGEHINLGEETRSKGVPSAAMTSMATATWDTVEAMITIAVCSAIAVSMDTQRQGLADGTHP